MQKKVIKRLLTLTVILTIVVWAVGLFGYRGVPHTLIILGLIIIAMVLVFVGMVRDDTFL